MLSVNRNINPLMNERKSFENQRFNPPIENFGYPNRYWLNNWPFIDTLIRY